MRKVAVLRTEDNHKKVNAVINNLLKPQSRKYTYEGNDSYLHSHELISEFSYHHVATDGVLAEGFVEVTADIFIAEILGNNSEEPDYEIL